MDPDWRQKKYRHRAVTHHLLHIMAGKEPGAACYYSEDIQPGAAVPTELYSLRSMPRPSLAEAITALSLDEKSLKIVNGIVQKHKVQ
jgi:hypothetical protein